MKKIMVFGTFDFLHSGHLNVFKQAKRFADHLTVVVGRDATVEKVKIARPIHNEKERRELVAHINLVDEAVLGRKNDIYGIILEKQPDIIGLGYDQRAFVNGLGAYLKKHSLNTKIVRLKAYKPLDKKSAFFKARLKFGV